MAVRDKEQCDDDIFKNGIIVSVLDITKADAEKLCATETEATGIKHDWHYSGGRVVIKRAK